MSRWLNEVMTLPQDRDNWRIDPMRRMGLVENTGAPTLPRDLRKMTERQRQSMQQYLQTQTVEDLRRRLDAVHSLQAETHQRARHYGTNETQERTTGNLQIMDRMLNRAIEYLEDAFLEDPDEDAKVSVREPAWQDPSWVLPSPDEAPVGQQEPTVVARVAVPKKSRSEKFVWVAPKRGSRGR